ncbi:unnamed protein product, partial [Prunus brigantina]
MLGHGHSSLCFDLWIGHRSVAQELGNLEQSRLDAYNSMQAQEQMAPWAYDKKVKQKTFAEGGLVRHTVLPIGTKNPR